MSSEASPEHTRGGLTLNHWPKEGTSRGSVGSKPQTLLREPKNHKAALIRLSNKAPVSVPRAVAWGLQGTASGTTLAV